MSFKKFTVRAFLITLFLNGICPFQKALAQRIVLPADSSNGSTPISLPSTDSDSSQILKTYPDGTKKIVPLAALNSYDNGKDFGGPPQLRVYSDPTTPIRKSSPERLSVAPIGTTGTPATINSTLPASPDSMGTTTIPTAAGDPMGGGSAPVDPLSGVAPQGSPPPLQTVSGKPAPVSSAQTSIELGTYDDFFMNAAIGGSIQGQLTSRRVYNGTNMQAYPLEGSTTILGFPATGSITAENFTFQPGFRFDTQFGYNIYDWLGVSLESGVIYNALQNFSFSYNGSITVEPGATLSGSGTLTCPADGELLQVPVQISVLARWPGATAFKPFIGGGVGAVWQQLDVNNINLVGTDVQANYCRSAFQFGFNGQVGANYTVTPGVDFYGVFKLLGAFTPRIGNYDFENSYNFALEVGIQSRF
jgi:hypothetical protein